MLLVGAGLLRAAAGSGDARGKPRDGRMFRVARLFRQGWNAVQLQALLGHADPGFTLRTYVHPLPEDLPEPVFPKRRGRRGCGFGSRRRKRFGCLRCCWRLTRIARSPRSASASWSFRRCAGDCFQPCVAPIFDWDMRSVDV